jgi:formate-dependent nitrite reductase cytochrome c552 subunit
MSLILKKFPALAWILLLTATTGIMLAVAWAQKTATEEKSANGSATADKPPFMHPVVVKPGPPTPRLDTGLKEADGTPITAACSTCHSTTTPNFARNTANDLVQAHRGLQYNHGNLTCLSCHNASNYDTLHLADNRVVEYPDVMTLCAQCHGTAKRDFDHGSHGGMNGHWDLTKGAQLRNNCVNCHDPHHPKFPLVKPVLPPRDRISVPKSPGSH